MSSSPMKIILTAFLTDVVDVHVAGVDLFLQHSGEVTVQHSQQLAQIASRQGPVARGILVQGIRLEVTGAAVGTR